MSQRGTERERERREKNVCEENTDREKENREKLQIE